VFPCNVAMLHLITVCIITMMSYVARMTATQGGTEEAACNSLQQGGLRLRAPTLQSTHTTLYVEPCLPISAQHAFQLHTPLIDCTDHTHTMQ
jgi:hypothetical protein